MRGTLDQSALGGRGLSRIACDLIESNGVLESTFYPKSCRASDQYFLAHHISEAFSCRVWFRQNESRVAFGVGKSEEVSLRHTFRIPRSIPTLAKFHATNANLCISFLRFHYPRKGTGIEVVVIDCHARVALSEGVGLSTVFRFFRLRQRETIKTHDNMMPNVHYSYHDLA